MRALVILGVVLCLVGAVFFLQGLDVLHGSTMSGHGGYSVLGAVMVVIGVALIVRARRNRQNVSEPG
jgi:uncharacterized membrane protein YidH (DUF202 family)